MDSAVLTPPLALRRLSGRANDVRAAALLDPEGTLAASEPADGELGRRMGHLAAALVAAAERSDDEAVSEVEVATPEGAVFVARRAGWVLAVVTSRLALSSLVRYDLRMLLAELDASAR